MIPPGSPDSPPQPPHRPPSPASFHIRSAPTLHCTAVREKAEATTKMLLGWHINLRLWKAAWPAAKAAKAAKQKQPQKNGQLFIQSEEIWAFNAQPAQHSKAEAASLASFIAGSRVPHLEIFYYTLYLNWICSFFKDLL